MYFCSRKIRSTSPTRRDAGWSPTVPFPSRSAWPSATRASFRISCRTVASLLVLAEPEVRRDLAEALTAEMEPVAPDDPALAVAPRAADLPSEQLLGLHRGLTRGT